MLCHTQGFQEVRSNVASNAEHSLSLCYYSFTDETVSRNLAASVGSQGFAEPDLASALDLAVLPALTLVRFGAVGDLR